MFLLFFINSKQRKVQNIPFSDTSGNFVLIFENSNQCFHSYLKKNKKNPKKRDYIFSNQIEHAIKIMAIWYLFRTFMNIILQISTHNNFITFFFSFQIKNPVQNLLTFHKENCSAIKTIQEEHWTNDQFHFSSFFLNFLWKHTISVKFFLGGEGGTKFCNEIFNAFSKYHKRILCSRGTKSWMSIDFLIISTDLKL